MLKSLFRRRPLIEELEPRILFSADLAPLALDSLSPEPEQRVVDAQGEFSSAVATTRSELVIVDTRVADHETLLADILSQAGSDRQISVVLLDADRDGIDQVSEVLKHYENLDAVHLITHGSAGMLQLGNSQLDASSLASRSDVIAAWGSAFAADGDLLLYGCNVAVDAEGQAFLDALSRLTGADVAASTDLTGSALLGGNWQLEFGIGRIESALLLDGSAIAWAGTLAVASTSESSGDSTTAVTAYSFSHAVQSGTDRLLLVELVIADGVNATAVDFNGSSLIFHSAQDSPTSHVRVELWYQVAPASVSGTVNVTLASAAKLIAGATSYSGVNQATPLGNVSSTSGNSTTPNATVAADNGDMVVDIVGAASVSSNTVGVSQTENFVRNQGSGATDLFGASSREIGATSVSMDHVLTSADTNWAMIAVEINRSSAVNTAPVLDSSKTPTLPAIPEDSPAPVGAVGVLVSTLVDYATPAGQVDNVTDPDGNPLGIAVTGVTGGGNGSWFYSTNDGGTWNAMGPVSSSSARLLFADGVTRIYFQPAANLTGSINNVITFRAWDRTSGFNGQNLVDTSGANSGGSTAFSAATDNVDLTVTAVNDAPTATIVPVSYSATEQVALTLHGTGLSIADVDAGSATVQATVTVTDGQLNAGAGTTGAIISGTGTASVTLTGTLTQINDLLAGNLGGTLTYTANSDAPPPSVTLTLTANDLGNTGSGGALTGSDTATINITAVNGAPVNSVPGAQYTAKNTALVFSASNGNAFSISDVDAGSAIVKTTLTVSSGVLNAGAGTTGVGVVGSGTGSVELTGTIAQINDLLAGNLGGTLSFAPANNFTGSISLTFTTNDQNTGASGTGGALSDTDVVTISVTDASLWLSTEGNATSSANSGNLSWQDSQVINFGNPTLSLGSGTTRGTFSIAINMNALSGDGNVDIKGLHVVSRAVTVGSIDPVNLQVGDVLFSVDANETFGGVSVTKRDIVLFRPATYGDYSSGTFSVLLRNPGGTDADVRDFALVESPVTVGGTALQAGDFLLLLSGGSRDKDVWHFRPNATGVATTGAAPTELVNGDTNGLNIGGAHMAGIELITQPVTIGGQALSAGQLLLSLDGNALIGGLPVQAGDVVALNLLTSGDFSTGTATMLMRASDVGLTGGGETLDALALVQRASSPPSISVDAAALAYTENDPATPVAPSATVSDVDSSNFGSGSLSVYLSGNGTANDRLGIRNQGNAAGQIGVSGSEVRFGGVLIGSFSGGEDGSTPLVVSLNANASLGATQALMRNITYANVSDDPAVAPRTVSVVLTDGNGGVSNTATRTITVTAVNDKPVPSTASASATEDTPFSITLSGSDVDGSIASFTVTALPAWVTLYTDAARTQAVVANTAYAASGNALTLYLDPDPDWNGTTSFNYVATDNLGLQSDPATANLTVAAVNDAPVAVADTATATEAGGIANGTAGTDPVGNVLANDTDVDSGDSKSVTAFSFGASAGTLGVALNGSYGALTLNADGSYSYVVDNSNVAVQALRASSTPLVETFNYTMQDGAGAPSSSTLTITINGANDAPIAVADTAVATEAGGVANGTAGTDPVGNVLANDTDVDSGDSKSVTAFSFGASAGTLGVALNGSYGALTLNADGSYTYVVDNGNAAVQALRTSSTPLVETFNYTQQDSAGASSSSTLTITINGANDAPTTSPVTLAPISEDSGGRLITQAELLANASDVESDALIASGLAISSGSGVLQDNLDGTWTYTPALNDDTSVSFSYNLSDGTIAIAGQATLDITPVNDAPVITSGPAFQVQEGSPASVAMTATDVENEQLVYAITGGADAALFTIDPDTGVLGLRFVPDYETPQDANRDNLYEVIVTVSDPSGGSSSLAIQLAVTDKVEATAALPVAPSTPAENSQASEKEDALDAPRPALIASTAQPSSNVQAAGEADVVVSIAYQNADTGRPAQMFIQDIQLTRHAAASASPLASLGQALSALASDARALQMLQSSFSSGGFQQQLDQLQDIIRQQLNLDKNAVASTLAVTTGLSVGYVIWLIRGGVLLSSLLTSLPAWRLIDPLPILGHLGTRRVDEEDDESLEGMLKKAKVEAPPAPQEPEKVSP